MKVEKLNESYSILYTDNKEQQERIINFLKVEKPNAYFDKMIQYGFRDRYQYFTKTIDDKLVIYNGHRFLLKCFDVSTIDERSEYTEKEIDDFLENVKLPFKPYDYQLKNVKLALLNNKLLSKSCTGSGKSLVISLIVEFFRLKKLKGLLIVPNINLLTQFKSDIESYGLNELVNEVQLLGNDNKSSFDTCLTITTWQSMVKEVDNLDKLNFDFIICDEAHLQTGDVSSDILKKSIHTKKKLGFTGTLPEDPISKMSILGLFGEPKTIITAKELIDRGLATPVNIKSIVLNYNNEDKIQFKDIKEYAKQLQFVKEHEKRSEIIYKIAIDQRTKNKNTLILFQHTEHGKQIFIDIMQKLYPDVKVENKDITGKHSLEFQKKYNVYFMNGEQSGKIREEQRNLIEELDNAILIANYAVCSTGVNMKKLHNLIFASPLKAFTTISQSLGRLMRKHESKTESNIFDIVDNFGFRKPSGIFYKQYLHRKQSTYLVEEFNVSEINVNL